MPACTASQIRFPSPNPYVRALARAAGDWRTWVPIAAAVAIKAGEWDQGLSDDLAGVGTGEDDGKGLFDSRGTADDLSDVVLAVQVADTLAPLLRDAIARPMGYPYVSRPGIAARLYANIGSGAAVVVATEGTKTAWKRRRPDHSDRKSFPSGHTSIVAWGAATMRYEAGRSPYLSRTGKAVFDAFYSLVPAFQGLLRVEAKKHYPSDALFGWGLGNFVGTFANEAFLEPDGFVPRISVRNRVSGTTFTFGLSKTL